jgi:hypothetical protein
MTNEFRTCDDASSSRTTLSELPITTSLSLEFSEPTVLSPQSSALVTEGKRDGSAKVVKIVTLAPPIEVPSCTDSDVEDSQFT